jgi:hypothetical protein
MSVIISVGSNAVQLIPETTMHAFDINALLTMIAINQGTKLTLVR